MKVGVDVDDVIYPWFGIAHDLCVESGLTLASNVPTQWECWVSYGCDQQTWLDVMEWGTLNGQLYSGEPMPGAIEALRALRAAGHTLHIVTARGFFVHGDLIRKHTVEWLKDWGVPHDSLTFSKDKTLVATDVFVDDSWKNVEALTAAGVPTWMVDAPHNRGVAYDFRVPSVVEFAAAILEMETV